MIGWIVKSIVATLLFAGSLVGGLAATGRLNHEGTANIPLLSSFFPAPAEEPSADGAHAAPDGETTLANASPQDPVGEQGPRRQKVGRTLEGSAADANQGPVASGEQAGDQHGASREAVEAASPATQSPEVAQASPEADFQRLAASLANSGHTQYAPGEYFRFDGMPAGLTAEQINEAWQRVQAQLADIEKRRTALELRETELQELADDVSRRQAALGGLRVEVEQMQRQLDARVEKFQQQVKLVRNDEVAALKRNAQTLASFEPSKAAELVQEQWKSERGQDEVLKLLEFMDKDAVNTLLQVLPTPMTQDLLKKRLRVTKESAPTGKGG